MMRDPKLDRCRGWNLTDAPRRVPLSVRLHILTGGFHNQFGWLFFGFGLFFVWLFGASELLHDIVFFSGELAVANGTITEITETGMSIDNVDIDKYHYTFSVHGADHEGADNAFRVRFKVDERVSIEYRVSHPVRSRLKGVSFKSWWALLSAIFPLIGLCFMSVGIQQGLRGARLLRNGKQAVGMLVSRERTNVEINGERVYKYRFEFEADNGRSYTAVARTHLTERFAGEEFEEPEDTAREAVPGEESDEIDGEDAYVPPPVREPLLYDSFNPSDAVMLDELPGSPRVDDSGRIGGMLPRATVSMFIPGITIVGHGWWFLHVLEIL